MATINFTQDFELSKQISALKASLKNLKSSGKGDSPEAKAIQKQIGDLQSQQTWRKPFTNTFDNIYNNLSYSNTLQNANGKQLAQNNAQYKKLKQQYDSSTDDAEKESLKQRMSDIELSMNDIKQRNTPNYSRLLAQGLSGWATSRDPTRGSAHLRSQGNLQLEEAAETQKAQQANAQIANQNYMSNADKEAAAQGAQKAMQTVRALGAGAGAGAAALAANSNVEVSDYDAHRMRSDERRDRSVENMQDKYAAKNLAEQSYAGADAKDFDATQTQQYNNMVSAASMGDDFYNTNPGSSTEDTASEETESTNPDTKVTIEPTAEPKSEEPETKSAEPETTVTPNTNIKDIEKQYTKDNSDVIPIQKNVAGQVTSEEMQKNLSDNNAPSVSEIDNQAKKSLEEEDVPAADTIYKVKPDKADIVAQYITKKSKNKMSTTYLDGPISKEEATADPAWEDNKTYVMSNGDGTYRYVSDRHMKNIIAGCFRRY